MNQKQRILIHKVGTATYKGQNPGYQVRNVGGTPQYVKVFPGMPFVRIPKDYK